MQMEQNTSGQGASSIVPDEIKGWNWGAFLVPFIWSIPNKVWIGLLWFILGSIMSIILGIKGNEWAWQNRKWESVDQFKKVQGTWAKCGIAFFAMLAILVLISIILPVFLSLGNHQRPASTHNWTPLPSPSHQAKYPIGRYGPRSFTADMKHTPENSHEGIVKLFVLNGNSRMEVWRNNQIIATQITSTDKQVGWFINHELKQYNEVLYAESDYEQTSLEMAKRDRKSRVEMLGNERVAGYMTDKYRITSLENPNDIREVFISPKLHFALRYKLANNKYLSEMELRNIKEQPISDSLFELPKGYRKVSPFGRKLK